MIVGREDDRPVADLLRPDRIDPVGLPEGFQSPATDCGLAPGGDTDWCLFGADGFAKRDAQSGWQATFAQDLGLLDEAVLRRIQVLDSSVWWMATNRGVFRFQGGGLLDFNVARTEGGLPSDDVRDILVTQDKVYVGTAQGIGVLDLAENSWSQIGSESIGNLSIRTLLLDGDETLWVGTDQGLYKHSLSEAGQIAFGLNEGLPDSRINDIAIVPDGRIFVATPGGVAQGDGVGDFERLGYEDGLPGTEALQFNLSPTGHLWVLSNFGVGRLNVQ
jgi:ligand-binding sensor domain-containing protein